MGPLDFMKGQPIADELGWVDVDKETLRHKKYGEQGHSREGSLITIFSSLFDGALELQCIPPGWNPKISINPWILLYAQNCV